MNIKDTSSDPEGPARSLNDDPLRVLRPLEAKEEEGRRAHAAHTRAAERPQVWKAGVPASKQCNEDSTL